jgi:ADP-ribose pyrophosphatase
VNHVRVVSRKLDYSKDWVRIYRSKVRLRDGKVVYWYTPKLEDFVTIIPIEGHDVYLTKEWRIAWNGYLVTAPAGGIGQSKTERQRLVHVRDEMKQEIGLDAKYIKKLGKILLSARTMQTCHVYLARNLFKCEIPRDEGEYLEVIKMPFKVAFQKFVTGRLLTTSTCIAAFALARELGAV